jgi:hypothetical protein
MNMRVCYLDILENITVGPLAAQTRNVNFLENSLTELDYILIIHCLKTYLLTYVRS